MPSHVSAIAPNAAPDLTFATIRAAIPAKFYQRSRLLGVIFLLLAFLVYGVTTYLLLTASSWWALCAFAAVRGLTIGPTFIVGHDACHDALTPSARWNRILGQIAFLPSWHSFTAWRLRHNFIHHRHTQILELDTGYPPADVAQYRGKSVWAKMQYRLSRTIPFAGLLYFPEWWQSHFLPSRERRCEFLLAGKFSALDHALVLTWMALEIALFAGAFAHFGLIEASHFHPLVMLFFGIVVTQFFWNWEMGAVTFLHHFHPDVAWYRQDEVPPAAVRQLVSTTHVKFPFGFNWLLLNIREHTTHHISPDIPLYHLPRAQAALKAAFPGEVTQEKFSVLTIWNTFAICKLWDAEAKRWVGYPK